jgi:hypothetical protein
MVPVMTLSTDDADTILRVFYRINRHGRRVSDEHLDRIREDLVSRLGHV